MTRFALLALPVALACTDVTPPDRPAPYQFSIDCSDPSLGCGDAAPPLLTFRWTAQALPVRLWVQPGADLVRPVADGMRLWLGAGLYGELQAAFVRDSSFADVLLFRAQPAAFTRGEEAPLDCSGRTTLAVAADTTMVLPFRTTITPRLGARPEEIDRCIRIMVAHELGHSLGLLLHSSDPQDLMYSSPQVEGLSMRDRASIATLYHSDPTVRIPGGR